MKKILIIDDFIPLLEEVEEFLSIEGYHTYSAKDGTEGIQKALQYNPDLIICDIEMPKMDGYEVYRTLEKIPSTSSIPFIFLTARTQIEDFVTGLELGADDYIIKPLNLDKLLKSISVRLSKYDRIKEKHQEKFDILMKNPLVGTFIYLNERFAMVNQKFKELTGYSKNEINNLNLTDLILGDSDTVISKLKNCLDNVYDSVQLKVSLLNKNKKAVFVELFARYVVIESNNAIIGTINEISNNNVNHKTSEIDQTKEFEKIIEYLISIGKDEIAEEIINIKDLFSFEFESKVQKIKKKVKLTKRESEILHLICNGLTNSEIAEKLFLSKRTVDNHRANLLSKTGTKNTALLVAFSVKNRLVDV